MADAPLEASTITNMSGVAAKRSIRRRAQFIRAAGLPSRPETIAVTVSRPIDFKRVKPTTHPDTAKLQPSIVLNRQIVSPPSPVVFQMEPSQRKFSFKQVSFAGLACLVFVAGMVISFQTVRTNQAAAAQVSALTRHATAAVRPSTVPSTTKPTDRALTDYVVAADMARYLTIPKLDVNARVMQVGVTGSGALAAPDNIFDTAWYTGSAKPGQPGATLIDGHVSSWTTAGVFYAIKSLVAGDRLQITRGDGSILQYRVVKTQIYPTDAVDMQAAVTPITTGKSGLNLITCTGKAQPGTSEFSQRVIVFSEQI